MPIDWDKILRPPEAASTTTTVEVDDKRKPRSHSQLGDYESCSWMYYLKRVLKLPTVPSVWLAGGGAFHTTTEAIDRAVYDGADFDSFLETYRDMFDRELDREIEERKADEPDVSKWRVGGKGRASQKFPNGEDLDWWRLRGKEMVAEYIEFRKLTDSRLPLATLDGQPAIETELRVELGGVPVVAYLDRLFFDRITGVDLIVDLKSGRNMPEEDDQLGLYSVMLGVRFGRNTTWGSFYNARAGKLTPPASLVDHTEEKLGQKFKALEHNITSEIFTPKVSWKCGTCEVKQFCHAQGGEIPPEYLKLEGSA